MSRAFNFSAGPAMLPTAVIERAQAEMGDWNGSGMSVMEMSHRGKEWLRSWRGLLVNSCAMSKLARCVPVCVLNCIQNKSRSRSGITLD